MKKNRVQFIVSILLFLGIFFFLDYPYFFVLFLICLVSGIFLYLLLRRDARSLTVHMKTEPSCRVGMTEPIQLEKQSDKNLVAAGFMEVEITGQNKMIGVPIHRVFQMKITKQERIWELPVEFKDCGEVTLDRIKIRIYDVFGVFSREVASFSEQHILVMPREQNVQVGELLYRAGALDEDKESVSRRGNNTTEVYELRDYVPGDPLRAIHWKLSGKMENFVVKEFSDIIKTDLLVYVDYHIHSSDDPEYSEKCCAFVAFVLGYCRKLLQAESGFMGVYPCQGGIRFQLITDTSGLEDFVKRWMGTLVPSKNGSGLSYLDLYEETRHFSNIVYLVNDAISEDVYAVAPENSLQAISVMDGIIEVHSNHKGNIHLMELPVEKLLDQTNRITV